MKKYVVGAILVILAVSLLMAVFRANLVQADYRGIGWR